MSSKSLSVTDQYPPKNVQRLASAWRSRNNKSIGVAFCKLHGTSDCPHGGICPNKGYCSKFAINASTVEEAITLFSKDAAKHDFNLAAAA